MRRMYSEQELTNVIKAVFEQELEDGALDENVSDAVDAYLVENPVDITALNGKTITPANVNATGNITANSIIEIMSGYTMALATIQNATLTPVYGGIVKNGNKLTIAFALRFNRSGSVGYENPSVVKAFIPSAIGSKIYVAWGSFSVARASNVECLDLSGGESKFITLGMLKTSNTELSFNTNDLNNLTAGKDYYFRVEFTLLLSENLLS